MTLATSFRYDKEKVDKEVATIEAGMLHEAISKKQLDHDHVLYIIGTRSIYQLRETFVAYKQSYGNTLDKVRLEASLFSFENFVFSWILHVYCYYGQDVDGCPGDADLRSLLQMVILCIEFPEKHFAKVLKFEQT